MNSVNLPECFQLSVDQRWFEQGGTQSLQPCLPESHVCSVNYIHIGSPHFTPQPWLKLYRFHRCAPWCTAVLGRGDARGIPLVWDITTLKPPLRLPCHQVSIPERTLERTLVSTVGCKRVVTFPPKELLSKGQTNRGFPHIIHILYSSKVP